MNTSNNYTIESVRKALSILKLFDSNDNNKSSEYTLMDIVDRLGYNKSTVLRLLYTLHNERFLRFDKETKKYSLDIEMIRLGTSAKNSLDILKVAQPYTRELSAKTGLVVYFAMVYDEQVVIVDKVFPSNISTIPYMSAQIGLALPVYASGIGLLFLGEKSEMEIRSILSVTELEPLTKNTVTNVDEIVSKAKQAHEDGVVYNRGELESFIASICYPIRNNTGEMVAGISIGGVMEQVEGEDKQMYEESIAHAATSISKALGYKS